MKIIFMLAAKTYMYLPLFLAKEKGIFKSVFEAKRIKDDIVFRICDGDDDAIDSMLDFNRHARKCKLDEIAIAISDPTSILRQHKSFDNKTDIKVIGKLINKLPFWVICPYNEELDNNSHNGFMDIKELKAKRLYTPNSSYITANSCCSQLLNKNNYKIKPVDFSEEIEKCINDSESIALTGDLNLMARKYIENKICIYSHMANNNDESIATTIITSRYICKQYEDMLALVLEAIQKAIFIIYSSPEIATEVCYKISDEIDSYRMPDENIQKEKTEIIISIINSDHLYPMTTDISFSDWKKTVNYYLSHGINIFEYMREHNSPTRPNENEAYVAGIYQKMFFKNPAHTAERKIVEDFGVDCNTFDKEIPYHLIRKLKNKILFFMKKDFWYILCFILFVCVVGYVVYQTFYNNNHDYISNVGLIFGALSLIWGILTSLGVFPKLKKTSRYDD